MNRLLTILFFFGVLSITHGYEQAFPKTAVGTIEIKTLPAATLIASQTDAHYFERNNSLFRPLFSYIQANEIAMTTPVEAEMLPGIMYFYIGGDAAARELPETDQVDVVKLPERTVLSIGIRGGYTASKFNDGEARLREWLEQQSDYEAAGAARAIYWNGPFTLSLLKRSEVHIPIKSVE
ncbi:MAG: heme-binding protein [Coraliomargarita sp.]